MKRASCLFFVALLIVSCASFEGAPESTSRVVPDAFFNFSPYAEKTIVEDYSNLSREEQIRIANKAYNIFESSFLEIAASLDEWRHIISESSTATNFKIVNDDRTCTLAGIMFLESNRIWFAGYLDLENYEDRISGYVGNGRIIIHMYIYELHSELEFRGIVRFSGAPITTLEPNVTATVDNVTGERLSAEGIITTNNIEFLASEIIGDK